MSSLAIVASTTHMLESLPARARADYERWARLIGPLLDNPPENLRKALRGIHHATGISEKTLEKRYYKARDGGLLDMIDRRLCGRKHWRRKKPRETPAVLLSAGMISLWRRLCEESNRSNRTAFERLKEMWEKQSPEIGAIPEFRDFPGWPAMPRGLTYNNLNRARPSDYELAVARRGRTAAKGLRPTVRTTRAGLWVGSHYMIDDMWHDAFVNSFAHKQAGRPLEVYILDYFSACKMSWGALVRIKRPDGKYQGIEEKHTRLIAAAQMHCHGYSPRGTVIVHEHRTGHISDRVQGVLHDVSGGLITCEASGLQHEAAHAGQYPMFKLGNPNFKAPIESNHSLYHNRMDYLPGQTGRNDAVRPAELNARLDQNERMLELRELLPEREREGMIMPFLEFGHYMHLCMLACKKIEAVRNHKLEGWIEAGNVVQMVDFGGGIAVPEYKLNAEQRARLPALMEAGLVRVFPERMSRHEVLRRGEHDLMRFPGYGICAILGDDMARDVKLGDAGFHVEDIDISPEPMLFSPVVRDAEGREYCLRKGEKFEGFVNPFAPDTLFVRGAKGNYLGESKLLPRVSRGDRDGIERAYGKIAHIEAVMNRGVQERHGAPGAGEGAGRARMTRSGADAPRAGGKTRLRSYPETQCTDGAGADAVTILLAENASEQNDGE
jgi:hypothetical protein